DGHRDVSWHDFPAYAVLFAPLIMEALGCEDPKVYRLDDGYVLFYNAIWRREDGSVAVDIMSAVSDDLDHWEKRGLVVPYDVSEYWAKGAVIPRDEHGRAVRIRGEYLMFLSEGCGGRPMVGHS
ncbi:hypothetical protein SB782_32385, partial [Brevibacillus sp. SIMBA_076]|uniref:hypothetical protein n=1 Tax=Brevibacillus sp. SIMBA_076 TaxID=3085814 RepID=UPI00397849FC